MTRSNQSLQAARQVWLRAMPVAAVGIALVALLIAASYRVGQPDEGDFSSSAYNLAHNGFFGMTVVDPVVVRLPGIHQHAYWIMPKKPLWARL